MKPSDRILELRKNYIDGRIQDQAKQFEGTETILDRFLGGKEQLLDHIKKQAYDSPEPWILAILAFLDEQAKTVTSSAPSSGHSSSLQS